MWILTLWAGCLSMEGADRRWEEWVAEHDDCAAPEDCVVVYTECPLGCWTAVAAEHEQAAIDEAESLVAAVERGGRSCAYDCLVAGEPECVDGACVVSEAPSER